jgi:hypothetical protein
VLRAAVKWRKVLRTLAKSYDDDQHLRLFMHFMMDMEKAYSPSDEPHYPFVPDQLTRMRRLAGESEGTLLGFAAF